MIFKKREPVLVLLFTILTCGIYYLYWVYAVTAELGEYLQNENSPALDLLLSLCCCPYIIYWTYRTGQQVFVAQDRAGLPHPQNFAVLYLLLSLFGLGPISAMIIQDTLNQINE